MQYQKIYPPPCKETRHGEIKTLERATKYGSGRKCEDPTVTHCRAFRKQRVNVTSIFLSERSASDNHQCFDCHQNSGRSASLVNQ